MNFNVAVQLNTAEVASTGNDPTIAIVTLNGATEQLNIVADATKMVASFVVPDGTYSGSIQMANAAGNVGDPIGFSVSAVAPAPAQVLEVTGATVTVTPVAGS